MEVRKVRPATKLKAVPASAIRRPPGPFQQRTNTSCQLALPTHGFTVVLSVFGGTPRPLNCKIRFLVRRTMHCSRAHRIGDQPMLVFAKFSLSPSDITWMSLYACLRSLLPLVIGHSVFGSIGKTKNPAYFRKQGWEKFLKFYLLTSCLSGLLSLCPIPAWDRPQPNARPRL